MIYLANPNYCWIAGGLTNNEDASADEIVLLQLSLETNHENLFYTLVSNTVAFSDFSR